MSGTTTPPPADDSMAQALRIADYIRGQQQNYAPPAPVDRSTVSLLGEAVGGGTTGLSPAEREAAGRRALLSFGANLSAASDYSTMPHSFGALFARGVGGAQESLAGSEAVSAARLGAQQAYEEKQQELRINAIKEAIPLLQLQQTERARQTLLGGGAAQPSGANISDVGAPIVPRDPNAGTAGQQANNPGNIMMAPGANIAGASGAIPLPGGRYVAAFPDVPTGVAAHSDLLTKYAQSGTGTIRDAVTRWVGPNTDPKVLANYVASVAKSVGAGPDDKVDLSDPKLQRAFILAQQPLESGKAWLSADDVDKGIALASARRAGAAKPAPTASAPPAAPAPAPTATAPPAAPGGPAAAPPPVVTDQPSSPGFAGPGAPPTARVATVSPAVPGDVNAIIRGMTAAGADAATLAPPSAPPAPVRVAGPGAPTAPAPEALPLPDAMAKAKATGQPVPFQGGNGAVITPNGTVTMPPDAAAAPPPAVRAPPAPEVPPAYVRQPLPPDIQRRIDSPETPEMLQAYRDAVSIAPDATALAAARSARATAIDKARTDAIAQGETWQAKQQELFNSNAQKLIDNKQAIALKQQELDAQREAAATKADVEAKAALLSNRSAQINKMRDTAIGDDTAQLKTLRTNADNSEGTIKELQILRSIEKQMPETGSVWLRDYPGLMDSFVTRLGMNKDEIAGMDARVLFQSRLSALATEMSQKAAVGPGTARGVEIQNNMAALPTQANDHTGRLKLMGFINNMAQDSVNRANEAEDYYYTHDHPNKELDLHQSLYKFPQYYDQKYPSIIPRAPVGATAAEMADWASKNVKPGMVFEAPIYKRDPLTGIQRNPRTGKPIVDHYEIQPREDDQ